MRWALCLKQGEAIAALTPIATGSRQEVLDRAEALELLEQSRTADGVECRPTWQHRSYAIVPVAMLPKAKRRAA